MKKRLHTIIYYLFLMPGFLLTAGYTGAGEAIDGQAVIKLSGFQVTATSNGVEPDCNAASYGETSVEIDTVESPPYVAILGIPDAKDSRRNKESVGEVINEFWPIILNLEEGIDIVLLADVIKILRLSHYAAEQIPNPKGIPTVLLELEIIKASVKSSSENLEEKGGNIMATFIFKALLIDAETGKDLWEERFTGEETIRTNNFSKQDQEETLNRAYCKALVSFSKSINTNTFKLAAQRGGR